MFKAESLPPSVYPNKEGFGETSPIHDFSVEKSPLCSPNSNFDFDDEDKLQNLYEKLAVCGLKNQQFVNSTNSEMMEFPIYCNNRACSNPGCMDHRRYLFKREHIGQIEALDRNIRIPKAWVFTGWSVPLSKLNREFCQKKLSYLRRLCSAFSLSAYSIHMEIKIYPDFDKNGKLNKKGSSAYLHFHVVSGGFRKLDVMRQRWKRQIKYEDAIKPRQLTGYVSKYASKTPYFDADFKRDCYHLLVYKTQMHRFSILKKDTSLSLRNSDFIPLDLLMYEVKSTLYRDSYLNPNSSEKRYFTILEKPPPENITLNFFNEFKGGET